MGKTGLQYAKWNKIEKDKYYIISLCVKSKKKVDFIETE